MSKLYVLYFVACYTVCIQQSVAYEYPPPARALSCQEPQSNNINWLADLVNKYKKVNICDIKADTKAVIDSEGRWIISYRADTVGKNELESEELCECMKRFLFQSEWTEGAIHVCKPECNSVTLFIIGARNKRFVGLKSIADTCEPVKVIGNALDKYSEAQLGGKNCKSTTGRTKTGQYRIMSECDNEPEPQKICSIMYEYLNADKWLDNTTTHECIVKDNKLYLDIVEKTVIGYCY